MSTIWVKRSAAIAGLAVLAAGTSLGVTHAQQTPAAPSAQGQPGQHMQAFMNAVAANLGISADQLRQAMQSARTQLGMNEGGWQGRHQRGGQQAQQGHREMRGMGAGLDAAAQAIGISPDELRQELPGKSLTDVARAHNVDPTVVANALKAAASNRIDQLMSQPIPVRGQRG